MMPVVAWPMKPVTVGVIGKVTCVGLVMGMAVFPGGVTVKAVFY